MPYEKNPMVRLFSLWEKRMKNDDGTESRYWTGIVGGVKYMMFRCKSNHPQAPMFDIYVAPYVKKQEATTDNPRKSDQDDYKPNATQETQSKEPPAQDNEEVPF